MSRIDQLERLRKLLDDGLITREEFEIEKTQLFGSSPGPPTTSAVQPNQAIGAYRVSTVIGRGGMGTVYRARHTVEAKAKNQHGDVALKLLHPQFVENASYIDRFEKEATLGLTLDHPGIVKVHDLVRDGEQVALVMELVDGKALSTRIGEERGPIPWAEAQFLFLQMLDAVGYAHTQGVIHRDLKPENTIITSSKRVKILDFGIAKEVGKGATRTGIGMGTLFYMAPEQHQNAKNVDARADIYALGITLYEMLAGRLPWDEEVGEFDVISAKINGKIGRPTDFYPYIPEQVVDSISLAIAPDPADRIASCSEFQRMLASAEGVAAPPPSKSPRPSNRSRPPKPPRPSKLQLPSIKAHYHESFAEDDDYPLEEYSGRGNRRLAGAIVGGVLLVVVVLVLLPFVGPSQEQLIRRACENAARPHQVENCVQELEDMLPHCWDPEWFSDCLLDAESERNVLSCMENHCMMPSPWQWDELEEMCDALGVSDDGLAD